MLTDDALITRVNKKYFDKSDVTDVISFRYDPMPGEDAGYSGEIVVNVQQARRNPRCGDESRELALYIAHGCDHLSGESDLTPQGYRRMRRRELRWLKQARECGLTEDLIVTRQQRQ